MHFSQMNLSLKQKEWSLETNKANTDKADKSQLIDVLKAGLYESPCKLSIHSKHKMITHQTH